MFLLLIGFNFTGPNILLAHFVGIGWSNGKWEAHLSRRFEFCCCCCLFLFRIPIPIPIAIVWGALWLINFKYAFWVFLRVYFSGKHAAQSVSIFLLLFQCFCFGFCLFTKTQSPDSIMYKFNMKMLLHLNLINIINKQLGMPFYKWQQLC